MRISIIAAATAITLAALSLCACSVMRPTDEDAASDAPTATQGAGAFGPVSAVTVTFGEEAQQLAATDTRLTPDAVAVAVEHELQRHHLYAPASPNVHRSLAITVENFTNELATNTRILGFTYRNVMLNGMVEVQGAAAQPPFDVHARVRITSHTTTAEGPSLAQLYTRFAVVTVAALRRLEPPAP